MTAIGGHLARFVQGIRFQEKSILLNLNREFRES